MEHIHSTPIFEAQIADFADGIAYNAHDLDDGITSGLLDLDQLRQVALWRENEDRFDEKYSRFTNIASIITGKARRKRPPLTFINFEKNR